MRSIDMRSNLFNQAFDAGLSETMQWCEPLIWDIVRACYRDAGYPDDRISDTTATSKLAALHVRCWRASLTGDHASASRLGAQIDALADSLGVERALIEKVDAIIAAEMNDVIVSRFRRGLYDRRRYCAVLERAIETLRSGDSAGDGVH